MLFSFHKTFALLLISNDVIYVIEKRFSMLFKSEIYLLYFPYLTFFE